MKQQYEIVNEIEKLGLEISQEGSGYTRLSRKAKRLFSKLDTLFIYTGEFFRDIRNTYAISLSKADRVDKMLAKVKDDITLADEDSKKLGEDYAIYDTAGMNYVANDTIIENAHYVAYSAIKMLEDTSGLSFKKRGNGDNIIPNQYNNILNELGKKLYCSQTVFETDELIPIGIERRFVRIASINKERGTIKLLLYKLDKNRYNKCRRFKVDTEEIREYNKVISDYLVLGIRGDRGINSITTLISDLELAINKIEKSDTEVKDSVKLTNAISGAASAVNILKEYIDYIIFKADELDTNVELLQSY